MPIVKINVLEEAKNLAQPFLVVDLAEIDDFAARLFVSEGMVAWHKHIDQEQLFFCNRWGTGSGERMGQHNAAKRRDGRSAEGGHSPLWFSGAHHGPGLREAILLQQAERAAQVVCAERGR